MQHTNVITEPGMLESLNGERLESWKEIAAHLRHSVRTVKRWENTESMPVHRHAHNKQSSVYAYKAEIDAWWTARRPGPREFSVNNNEAPFFVQFAKWHILDRVPCVLKAASIVLLFNLLFRLLTTH